MIRWLFRLIGVGVVGFIGYGIYDYFKAGLHTRPSMPEGAFSLSFAGGPRVILLDIADERDTRRYVVRRRTDDPDWFKESWSSCLPPTKEEEAALVEVLKPGLGMRLDGVCALDADGDIIPTGYILPSQISNHVTSAEHQNNRATRDVGSPRPRLHGKQLHRLRLRG